MIQALSDRYRVFVASPLFLIFYIQLIGPLYFAGRNSKETGTGYSISKKTTPFFVRNNSFRSAGISNQNKIRNGKFVSNFFVDRKFDIGGPSSPEASSFQAVGSNNLVNLFTGDFSYSIPLLDVGGYPVNLFYNGGISMEQEASWVGLGWNINPGSVSRNMRGVPDDFDGTDSLKQTQNVKPNRTWGGEVGVNAETLGIPEPVPNFSLSLGFSYNNYLGPALDVGSSVSLSIPISQCVVFEKTANLGLSVTAGAKLSSRSGFSPSLNANLQIKERNLTTGVGLSTSYNSRTGIKDLTLSSQISSYRLQQHDQGKQVNLSASLGSTTFSFAKPSYMPVLRMPMEYANYSGQLELGAGMFGLRGGGTASGYYSEYKVPSEWKVVTKPLVGFMFSENATNNKNAVMDFTRVNDGEVTPNTPVISAPQYAYDIFTIQGEGTGGSIRAYRGDLGFMRDNVTTSKDKNFSIGFDIAPPGHFGGNWNIISSPTRAGGWDDGNNTLLQTMSFKTKQNNSSFENVYFKNPGEATVTNSEMLTRIGGDNLVRFKLDGSNVTPRLETQLELFNKKTNSYKGSISVAGNTMLQNREKRTQVTTMLTADDASKIGLEKQIRNYTGGFDSLNNIQYDTLSRVGGYRKKNHISEVDVLEQNGMRYVYGLPVYNVVQKDFTFSVDSLPANLSNNLVGFTSSEATINSPHMVNSSRLDGYMQSQETPAYASSFLLTGLLSPDYVDVTGDGITEDDLGSAVKFNYTKSSDLHKWRTPRNNSIAASANFNEGIRTEKRDNRATISYGEREVWYLNSIESKSMIAIFKTESRNDAKGVISDLDGRVNASENANKKLSRIDLYTKAEIKAKGITNAKPLKTVQFYYSDSAKSLCPGTPDNKLGFGKLTLDSIKFSYNGQTRQKKELYVFNYGNKNSATDNPSYAYNASDRWGTYKDPTANPSGLVNADYPYTLTDKTKDDQYAAAWSLKKVLLPSGGQIEVQYEADDYGYVQDRRACNMLNIYGLGKTTSYSSDSSLYSLGISSTDNLYVYVKLPQPLVNTDAQKIKQEIFTNYLEGINQLAFKLQVVMPKGREPLTAYAEYDDYGLCANSSNKDYIYIKLRPVDGKSPLANSSIGFLTESLPAQAFPGYDIEVNGVAAFLDMVSSMLGSLKNAFKNVNDQMRSAAKGRLIVRANSFIRLDNPSKIKYGGGLRVKRLLVKDNWNKMTNQFTSVYGQDYDYTTTEKINGKDTTISSGVASYEPAIGNEENPFREILSFSNKLPLSSAQYGAIEMPMLEGLYPAPCVGYSKVTVRSIHRNGTHGDSTLRSAIGKQVTEFYTAKDYPSYSSYTPMNSVEYNKKPFLSVLYKEVLNRRTISQGFLVETNDMHGKMKSQAAYSESDEKTPLSYSYHTYKNTGRNGLNDKVDFVYSEDSAAVRSGNMGIDAELMTDVREFRVQTNGFNGQIQTDFFTFVPWPIFLIPFLPIKSYQENLYRAVTCTKLINYHAFEDSVIVMDKGSVVSTKTIAYDAETGNPIVTKTGNEFNDPIYNISYPAYWAYSGTAPAYKNIGREFSGVNFHDGKIQGGSGVDTTVFESGDEIYVTKQSAPTDSCGAALVSPNAIKLWAYDKNKNTTALTVPNKNIVFIDENGKLFTKAGVTFRIVRSGKRNNLDLTVSAVTTMGNPIRTINGINSLVIDSTTKTISASAIEYKEKWQVDNDIIKRKNISHDENSCAGTEVEDCDGYLEKNINPYLKGLIGNFKPYRSYVFYGERQESNVDSTTAIRRNGYLKGFANYWSFNSASNLIPNTSNTKWVWNSELTKVNSKGQELETHDPLNRYTAAQYGFTKNFPIAVVQNSRYGEAFDEGFEDYAYAETINKAINNNCAKRYIDLSGISNSSLINTDTSPTVKAHSGKYALKINGSSSAVKQLDFKPATDSFSFAFNTDTTHGLYDIGGNIETVSASPVWYPNNQTYVDGNALFGNGGFYIGVSPLDTFYYSGSNQYRAHNFTINTSHYINVPQSGTYTISVSTGADGEDNNENNSLGVYLEDLSENVLGSFYTTGGGCCSFGGGTIYLCKGIYKIVGNASNSYEVLEPGIPEQVVHSVSFAFNIDVSTQSYKSQSTQNGCVFTKPISATDSMLNSTFSLVPGERMQFSAWVKEDCGNTANTPCYKTKYSNNHVAINFNSGAVIDTFHAGGPIIEGWQKIDGEFTVPSNATSATLVLSNDSTRAVYFDDIRIHPFNANMKSYVYDPRTLRLSAELDENNYASFYEYDEEGQLVRVKKETVQGIKTIKETRSAKQKTISDLQ